MSERDLTQMSKDQLIRELEKLEEIARRASDTTDDEGERERLVQDLHTHQVELEMQNRELRESHERLQDALARYADLYDFAPLGYCTLDPGGYILEINLTGAALLGAPRQQLIGKTFSAIAPLKDRQTFTGHMKRCVADKTRVTTELTLRLAKRGERVVQLVSEPVESERELTTAYRTMIIDISELKELEGKLRLLSDAGVALGTSLDIRTMHAIAARVAVPGLADLCAVDLLSESGEIERVAVVFADPKNQDRLARRLGAPSSRPNWQTAQARVIESGEPMLLAEMSDELRERLAYDDDHAAILRAAGIRSVMIVPLVARGHAFGALTFGTAEDGRRYAAPDLLLAENLTGRIALALDNARLYAESLRANEALRLAEAKATGIVSVSADAILSIDEAQNITMWNAGAEAIFGYSKTEAIGSPLGMLIPARLRVVHRLHVEQFARGTTTARRVGERGVGVVGLRKNGEEFPADAAISKLEAGGKNILTASLRDISEQKRIEKEQRFLAEVGLVLATTLDYDDTVSRIVELAVRDLADLCIVDIVGNDEEPRRLKIVSREPSKAPLCDALMKISLERGHPSLTQAALEKRQPVLMKRVSPETIASLAQNDEHRRVLEALDPRSVIAVPLLLHGQVLGALALVGSTASSVYTELDVRLADELARRAAFAVENARLYRTASRAIRARDDVIGIVAHDLRNPLSAVLVQAQLLRRYGPEADGRSKKPAERIERAATRMKRLIEDLLDVTRIEAGRITIEKTSLSVTEMVTEAVDAQRPLASSASVELRLDVAPDLPEVCADRDRMFQVFENLIGNAIKFTKPGGRVTVGAAREANEVVFRVADTGSGIAPDNLFHLFDRFWQVRKADRRGAGLGLSIAKGIVQTHGGRVWAESKLGVGTTLFFTLTISETAPRASEATISATP